MPKSSRTRVIAVLNEIGSEVFPAKTSIATGRPSGQVSSPYSICLRPRLPSRECPNAARSQHFPSTHEEDRPDIAIPPGARCRAASFFSMPRWRPSSQSIAAYTSSVPASATPRSVPIVVSPDAHHVTVDSFDSGRTARDTISA